MPFDEARRIFMRTIPKSALLIGYNIDSDLGWLKLTDPDQEDPERKEDRVRPSRFLDTTILP